MLLYLPPPKPSACELKFEESIKTMPLCQFCILEMIRRWKIVCGAEYRNFYLTCSAVMADSHSSIKQGVIDPISESKQA